MLRHTGVLLADFKLVGWPFYPEAVMGGGSPKNMPMLGKVIEEPGRSSQNPYLKSFGPLLSPAPRGTA